MGSERRREINNEDYLDEIKRLVKDIAYGSITIIIQDGKVIQIDKTQKIRIDRA